MTSKEDTGDGTIPLMGPGRRAQFVIALDFGTTYSGVGWALEGCEEEILKEWPGGQGSLEKVPTQFSYHSGGIRWGYQVDHTKEVIRGIKLLLDRKKADNYAPAIESIPILDKMGKEPVDAAVPAVWSDKAKALTTQAACLAGIPKANLCLLSEPEAAAVYAIQAIQPNSIGTNDSFIVCDAGGGTVDLITYRVTQIEPMRLEEVAEGTGGMCGSMALDSRFQKFIIETVGKKNYDKLKEAARKAISKTWESDIKTRYEGPDTTDSGEYSSPGEFIPMPGVPDIPKKNVEDGMFYMENSQIQSIFDPTIEEIESLVMGQQVKANEAGYPPKAVLLVGGLGSSKYLFKRLEGLFSDMRIMQPQNSWSAIIRGAVHRGLEGNQVEVRKATCHYGVSFADWYDPVVHGKQQQYWEKYREKWMVDNQMKWYIQKDSLEICPDEVAPKTLTGRVIEKCKLESDLSKVPKELFQKCKTSKGLEFYDIRYNLVLTPLSASLLFEFEFNSMSYGTLKYVGIELLRIGMMEIAIVQICRVHCCALIIDCLNDQ